MSWYLNDRMCLVVFGAKGFPLLAVSTTSCFVGGFLVKMNEALLFFRERNALSRVLEYSNSSGLK